MAAIPPTEHDLIYDCPHCGRKVQVDESQLDSVIDCPNPDCGRPFEVPAPRAHLSATRSTDGQTGQVLESKGPADIEKDVLVCHPAMFRNHPLRYIAMLVLVVAGVAGWWLTYSTMSVLSMFSAGVALVGLVWFFAWWLQTRYQSLTVTNRRTLYRQGIIARRTNEVQHDDVRNIQIEQGMIQRILGVGRIAISSSGQADLEIDVYGVPDPEGIAETVRSFQ